MKSVGKSLSNILLILVLIIVISLTGSKIISGKASIFGYMPVFIMTSSMEPQIHAKTFIIMKPINATDVKVGDIVAYNYKEGKINVKIIYRVIDINNGVFTFKGDANTKPDPKKVFSNQILYKKI